MLNREDSQIRDDQVKTILNEENSLLIRDEMSSVPEGLMTISLAQQSSVQPKWHLPQDGLRI